MLASKHPADSGVSRLGVVREECAYCAILGRVFPEDGDDSDKINKVIRWVAAEGSVDGLVRRACPACTILSVT